jgi:hypothetical protein
MAAPMSARESSVDLISAHGREPMTAEAAIE